MNNNATDLKFKFKKLLELFEENNDDECQVYFDTEISPTIVVSISTNEEVCWVESNVDGYNEFPEVEQDCIVKFDDVVVATFSRVFGVELIDASHNGLVGTWSGFRVDDQSSGVERLLDFLLFDIDEPDVPDPVESEEAEE